MTPRQRQVLNLMAADKSHKEIAASLHIAVKTVDFHASRIRHALRVHTQMGIIVAALRLGLLKGIVPLLILASAGSTATYYVATTGSDSTGNGSSGNPWATIGHALGLMAGGDTLLVNGGIYSTVTLTITGPSGSGIGTETTVKANAGQSPVLQGTGNTGRVKLDGVLNFILDGFTVSNFNQGIYIQNSASNVIVRNCDVGNTGQEIMRVYSNCHDIFFISNRVHDSRVFGAANGEGFYIGTSSGPDNSYRITARSNYVANTISEGAELKEGTHDCILEYFTMTNCSTPGSGHAIEVDEATGWGANPNHIVRGNVIYASQPAIRLGTGCLAYNNVIYGLDPSYNAIDVDNLNSDSYPRQVYNNTIIAATNHVLVNAGGTLWATNNIGPTLAGNILSTNSFFVNTNAGNFRLAPGAAPIAAGANLSALVPTDFDGKPRGAAPSMGAFEFGAVLNISGSLKAGTLKGP